MKLIYTRITAAAALEVGTIANPDYYEHPNRSAEEVIIYGNYPKIQNDYEALDIPVEVRKLEEPAKTTLATVNVDVGITPELQALIDDAHAECEKATEENSQLRKKVSILEQAAGNQSDLTAENSRLKDALTNAEKSVQTINEQFTLLKAEYEAFQNDVDAMGARIGELTAGSATESQNDVPKLVDYESWDEDQIKELLTSKDIGYKPTATKAQLLKLIPKE
jgi:uncharacterized protein (DUF342 family)